MVPSRCPSRALAGTNTASGTRPIPSCRTTSLPMMHSSVPESTRVASSCEPSGSSSQALRNARGVWGERAAGLTSISPITGEPALLTDRQKYNDPCPQSTDKGSLVVDVSSPRSTKRSVPPASAPPPRSLLRREGSLSPGVTLVLDLESSAVSPGVGPAPRDLSEWPAPLRHPVFEERHRPPCRS